MNKIKLTKFETIFLDFDGTLKISDKIKGVLFYEIFKGYTNPTLKNKILQHHYDNLGLSRYKKIPIYMKYCNIKVNPISKKKFTTKYNKLVFIKVCKCHWVRGAKKFLKNNKNKKLILVTASPHKEIIKILKKIKIYDVFTNIYGHPFKKKDIIKKIISNNKLETKKYIYIGNSKSDYLAAKQNKVKYLNIGTLTLKHKKIINIGNFDYIN
tara:strand:- start:1741 stop:2373 length:633 start_codon:yes stop_codon:yes gene_type:complete